MCDGPQYLALSWNYCLNTFKKMADIQQFYKSLTICIFGRQIKKPNKLHMFVYDVAEHPLFWPLVLPPTLSLLR